MSTAAPNQSPANPAVPASASSPAPQPPVQSAPVPPPPPASDLLKLSTFAFRQVDYALKGYHLDATVPSTGVVSAAEEMARQGFALDTITGVDWLAEKQMEVVYDYFHPLTGLRVVVRSRLDREAAELPTISEVFPGANWHERETHDFFGIRFVGHPNLQPFLLPEDATYHPLKKDFIS